MMKSMNTHPKHFDIIVIGASLVGMSFLLAMQELDLNILVIEKENLKSLEKIDLTQSRPITLSYGSVEYLKKIGIWEKIELEATPILQVHVSQRGHFGTTQFSAAEENVQALGFVVPFDTLKNALITGVVPLSQITWAWTDQFQIIHPDSDGATLSYSLENGKIETASTELLVVAAGNNETLRKQLQITSTEQQHNQVAVTAQVCFEMPHRHIAYERMNAPGIFALLPMKNENQCGLVWTVKQDADIAHNASNALLLTEAQKAFGFRLGKIIECARTGFYPLITSIADQQIKPGLVLLGNIAHTIYPIAAQGFNLSLRDVMQLATVLKTAHAEKKPLGSLVVLNSYLEARKSDQNAIIRFVEKTDDIFSLDFPGIGIARSLGLLSLGFLPRIKKKLAKKLLGLQKSPT